MTDERDDFAQVEEQVRAIVGPARVARITKGFSFDEKYLLTCGDNVNYLLRITRTRNPAQRERKMAEYEVLRRLMDHSSLVPGARSFGTAADGALCFMVLSYFAGNDGEEVLCTYSEAEQYRLGVRAGAELKKLHALPAPASVPDWHEAFRAKTERKITGVAGAGLDLPGVDARGLASFFMDNIRCIKNTRQTFLHDDYHPGNLIFCNGELSGIIDFNRFDWGDPVHDFVKLAYFTRAQSIAFCTGQIHGYFLGEPPDEFWKRYALYCAATVFSDTLWSHQYEETSGSAGEAGRSEQRIRMVVSDHEGFTRDVPGWYRKYVRPYRVGAR